MAAATTATPPSPSPNAPVLQRQRPPLAAASVSVSWARWLWIVLLVHLCTWQSAFASCTDINFPDSDHTSWERFTSELSSSFQTNFCPFIIEGEDNCPSKDEGQFEVFFSVIVCERLPSSDCVINCPHASLKVLVELDMLAFVWKNSQRTAIELDSFAAFYGTFSTFEGNGSLDPAEGVMGGAIYAPAESTINLENCNFEGNSAMKGGAIYYEGDGANMPGSPVVVEGGLFFDNVAVETGGAIHLDQVDGATISGVTFVGNNATDGGAMHSSLNTGFVNVRSCEFEYNDAGRHGGALWALASSTISLDSNTWRLNGAAEGEAVLDATGGIKGFRGNTACGNGDCDGIATLDGACQVFSLECSLPTNSPSFAPSTSPSQNPSSAPSPRPTTSLRPSQSPSNSPTLSQAPSQAPSEPPTISSRPSLRPSSYPTVGPTRGPTRSPTIAPTRSPTLYPSEVPSEFPSTMPSLSGAPSNFPSLEPSTSFQPTPIYSDSPSLVPSSEPSLSTSPSLRPSPVPTETPTAFPSDAPSTVPSDMPSQIPSPFPSDAPSSVPSDAPSSVPSFQPSGSPTSSSLPTIIPTK